MAKFKVGDKVTYWVFDEKMNGTIKDIRGNKAEVVQGNEKAGLTFPLKDLEAWNSCRSTNAVVAKALNACGTARNAGDRDMYEDAIRQAIVKCEAAIKYEPDADDYSDVTRLVKQAKDLLAKAYRAI